MARELTHAPGCGARLASLRRTRVRATFAPPKRNCMRLLIPALALVHLLGCDPEKPQHVMGTDGNVRDEFSRIIYGARVSLTLGFFTVTIALVVGSFLGAVAGWAGGWFDNIIMIP